MAGRVADREPSSSFWFNARHYLRHAARGLVSKQLQAKIDSSDLVQLTLFKASNNLHQIRGQTDRDLLAWLRRILENTAGEQWRYHLRDRRDTLREQTLQGSNLPAKVAGQQATEESCQSPSQAMICREHVSRLCDDIAQLPDAQRTAVVLRHLHGAPIAEIAESMGRTEAAIGGLLRRGMQRLRELTVSRGDE